MLVPPAVRLGIALLLAIATGVRSPAVAQDSSADQPIVYAAEVDSIIQPVAAEYMIETMAAADRENAALVVFTLRTPGGLVDSTRDIITRMVAAKTPVAIYVAPSGARAASAGFLLTIAADIAAMAPGTHIGAAHPVAGAGEQMDETMSKKAEEDVAAYVRTLAAARHRNVELATAAVRSSRAFTETEALEASPPLIDFVVPDLQTLLSRLDGRTIQRFDGRSEALSTRNARIVPIEMSFRQRVLSAVAHPNVAYLLLSLGMLGLTIELWSPGAIVPGVVGGLALLLGFFALQVLPVNYAGVLLLLFGLTLLALEIKVTSYGLLTLGGVVSLTFGSMMLFDSSAPELQVSLTVVVPVVVGFTAIAAALVRLGLAAQRRPAVTGMSDLIGRSAEVVADIEPDQAGQVAVRGEIWRAVAPLAIARGSRVRIEAIDGLTLTVRQD
jgi:membrane-bound serine protease (ClpP class)